MEDLVAVRFRRGYLQWNPREIAGFSPKIAKKLVETLRVAMYLEEEKKLEVKEVAAPAVDKAIKSSETKAEKFEKPARKKWFSKKKKEDAEDKE